MRCSSEVGHTHRACEDREYEHTQKNDIESPYLTFQPLGDL